MLKHYNMQIKYGTRMKYVCNELGIHVGQRRLYSDATGLGRSGSHKEKQTHSGDGMSVFND